MGGAVADKTNQDPEALVIRKLNEKIYIDDRVDSCLIPIGDGLTIAFKR